MTAEEYERRKKALKVARDEHPDMCAWMMWRAFNPGVLKITEHSKEVRELYRKREAVWHEFHSKEADLWHEYMGVPDNEE